MPGHSPLRLPVRTESGQKLGTVVDITVDPSTHTVVMYHVKPSRLMPDMVKSPLFIHRSQVVEMTDRELVVDDAVNRQPSERPAALPTS